MAGRFRSARRTEKRRVTGAAKRLGRATSSISYAIDTLEALLGLSQFDRGTTRKPKLTQQGEAVLRAFADSIEDSRSHSNDVPHLVGNAAACLA